MHTNKLFRYLLSIEKEEQNEVRKFLESPYFNTHADCTELFLLMRRFHPHYEDERLSNKTIFHKLYGNEPFSDVKIRKLRMRLIQLLEQYFAVNALKEQPGITNNLLLKNLRERDAFSLFYENNQQRREELDQQPERGSDYLWEMYHLLSELHFHPESAKYISQESYFQKAVDFFDAFQVLVSLENYCELILISKIVVLQNDGLEHKAKDLLEKAQKLTSLYPAIAVFSALLQVYHKSALKEDIVSIKKVVFDHLHRLHKREQKLALKLLIYYLVQYINLGDKEIAQHIFEVYQYYIVEAGLLDNESTISFGFFINVVVISSAVFQFEWATRFIDRFSEKLSDTEKDEALKMSLAMFYYHRGQYNHDEMDFHLALEHLGKINNRSFVYNNRLRTLTIRIYYYLHKPRTEDHDRVLDLVHNFERYIRNEPAMSENKKTAYLSFARFMKTLVHLRAEPDINPTKIKRFIAKVKEEKECILKHWLLESAEELIHPSAPDS